MPTLSDKNELNVYIKDEGMDPTHKTVNYLR